MYRIESLNYRIVKSCYDSTSINFILIRTVRFFYQLTILPSIRIVRLFLNHKIVESQIMIAILITMLSGTIRNKQKVQKYALKVKSRNGEGRKRRLIASIGDESSLNSKVKFWDGTQSRVGFSGDSSPAAGFVKFIRQCWLIPKIANG